MLQQCYNRQLLIKKRLKQQGALAQQYIQTTKYRNLVIDLGNGVKTNAQLTLPAIGKGPFPGVLLIPGTVPFDMNEPLGIVRIDNRQVQKYIPLPDHFGK